MTWTDQTATSTTWSESTITSVTEGTPIGLLLVLTQSLTQTASVTWTDDSQEMTDWT